MHENQLGALFEQIHAAAKLLDDATLWGYAATDVTRGLIGNWEDAISDTPDRDLLEMATGDLDEVIARLRRFKRQIVAVCQGGDIDPEANEMPGDHVAILDLYSDGETLYVVEDTGEALDESLKAWHTQDFDYSTGKIDEDEWLGLTDWLKKHSIAIYPRRVICL